MNQSIPVPDADSLEGARQRRLTLKQAISAVEVAASSPAADPNWRKINLRELGRLRAAFDDHVAEVEADDGLLRDLVRDAPRLQNRISEVEAEHPTICAEIDATIALAEDPAADTEELRAAVMSTLMSIVRHRQAGSDLVYNAYQVDIGISGA